MHTSTFRTPYARWRSLPLGATQIYDGFWARRQAINRQVSLRRGYEKLQEFGNLDNLCYAAGRSEGPYRGPLFMDSDLYKWLEAVALDQANATDSELLGLADGVIDLLAAAQDEDGYLNSYWQMVRPADRWTDLDHGHELYCAGHLIEAAIAYLRATGSDRLLEVARRFADYIDTVFGPGKCAGTSGHPEIELALVELYRETGERRYLDLARFFIDQRGQQRMGRGGRHFGPEYHQDRVPVREAAVVEGHAVRQLYLTAGVTDLYLETGDSELLDAVKRLWRDMTVHKMHITAGFGARYTGEAFGDAYELPSDRCYCETCAAIAAMMWNWRMLLATREARYADLLERSLYNGFLSGVSLDGERYFYVNPLQSRGGIERPKWHGCACCPPNVMRQIALVGHFAATVDCDGLQIHQYMCARLRFEDTQGCRAVVRMESDYPWNGEVGLTIEESGGGTWRLSLRVPGWCDSAEIALNGERVDVPPGVPYAHVARKWMPGDRLELRLKMEPRLTRPNPRVDAIRGCVAIERGPLVYCLEEVDQEPGASLLDLRIAPDAGAQSCWRADLLGGVMVIQAPGCALDLSDWDGALYRTSARRDEAAGSWRRLNLTAVPYYAWANRGAAAMRVWIPTGA